MGLFCNFARRGASEGMTLVLNTAAMLIGFVALMALINALLGWARSCSPLRF
jgi:concentrative nucleoside transporter, CNT family